MALKKFRAALRRRAVFVRISQMLPSRLLTFASLIIIVWAFVYAFFIFDTSLLASNEEIAGSYQNFTAKIIDIDRRLDRTFLIVRPENLTKYKIRITASTFLDFHEGQILHIEGKINIPENFAGFNYQGWLAKDNIAYVMFGPDIQLVDNGEASYIAQIKEVLFLGVNNSLLPPHSALYSAMLLDERGGLTQQNRADLSASGLTHIIAISGQHISIIALLLISAGLSFGLWRQQAGWLALVFIIFYIWMVGAPASAVRAGIMASTIFLAERFGRPGSSWRALLLAGAAMLAFNPLLVRYDAGFQLSFLAVAGILFLSPYFLRHLSKVPNIFHARDALAMTLSAQVFTAPLVLFIFGIFAPFGVVANILVVTILPAVLISSFIAAFAGVIGGPIMYIAALPAWAFSQYIWMVASIFS